MTPLFWQKVKSLLMEVKEESEKAGLKLNIQKMKIIGEGNGNPLQYSCLEKSMDRVVWRAEVHGITWLSMCARGWREMGW